MPAVTAPLPPRAVALAAVSAGLALLLAGVSNPARAQDDAGSGSTTSLRLTSPVGGLWLRGKGFGPTTLAESANLGATGDPSWRLLGSYDLPKASGLRATGGMIGVTRRTALGAASLLENQRWDNGLTRGWIEGTRVPDTASQANQVSVPYAGIGYSTSTSFTGERGLASSAWSFNIDLGVMALAPRSSVRFGGADPTQTRLDDMLRELRLSPLLQLGVSYSF
jgi:hypothetical protein